MAEKKSSRVTLRHDYGKLNSEGFGWEQSEIPSDNEVVVVGNGAKEGGHSSSTGRKLSQSDETLLLLENEYESLVREEEELQNEARINKLKKKISLKRKSLAELRVSRLNRLRNPKIKKCIIISDSIAKHVSDIWDTDIRAFPRITISQLTSTHLR
ncbi:uncharacterized protein LOC132717416, partial [Ruditapes philippinarum]|uniref:uncharacterized protein LOC132717416 n=1 Tax=Ruditapes philippinarum TaxID=129788 RepID=UPI00295AE06A